jgi:ubiquinone/menaquinone biosynthesis C-methylase UbiE
VHLRILPLLCDPATGEALSIEITRQDSDEVIEGVLVSPAGNRYPIRNRIPRFVEPEIFESVRSFGDQWNHFNYVDFKQNWLDHTVRNTFGSTEAFRDRVIVDCGGGSGSQSLWMLEAGAREVIMLELSHSVDDVVARNIENAAWPNFTVIQCSIDQPPIRQDAIDGIVICHNVIQHTESVEKTARALFGIVAPGGEFVFNCYRAGKAGLLTFIKNRLTYGPLRRAFRDASFERILAYSRLMGLLRLVPGIGKLTNKLRLSLTGKVPRLSEESWLDHKRRIYRQTVLNTFDMFGSHSYQHQIPDATLRALVLDLQPDAGRIGNLEPYFTRPQPTGIALRVRKG